MNRWTYFTEEVSPGVYEAEAIRDTHNSVRKKGFEPIIQELLRESFEIELSLGTTPGEALFHVTKGFKSFWSSEYLEKVFGSWTIQHPNTRSAIEYDGKEFWIVMRKDSESWPNSYWSGRLPNILENANDYFEKLVRFY